MQKILSLATVGDLANGTARGIIDKAIAEAVRDLDDRGSDHKPRKIKVEIELKLMESGLTEACVTAIAVVPPRRTGSTVAKIKQKGQEISLQFQDLDATDPDQRTIDDEIDRNRRE